jgi:hypothetical protein
MCKGDESILVARQEIVVLPKAKPTVVEGVLMVVRIRYSELRFN